MSSGFWGINTIGLPDSLVCASHSLWLSIMFLMKLIITTVLGGRSVQRLRFALISLICSLREGWEFVRVVQLVRVETEQWEVLTTQSPVVFQIVQQVDINRAGWMFSVFYIWCRTGIKYEWLKHWGVEGKLGQIEVVLLQTELLWWLK